jgi:hypothetical protein
MASLGMDFPMRVPMVPPTTPGIDHATMYQTVVAARA